MSLKDIISIYFFCCDHQPLALFHPETLSHADRFPEVLLLALAAISVNFSKHPFFESDKDLAADKYSGIARGLIAKALLQCLSSYRRCRLFAWLPPLIS
jgi:hypothetical protein